MNENDIKKALEWCEQFENNIVFKGNGDKKCALALQMMVVIKHALKNYTRQKAEIERLQKELPENKYGNRVRVENGLICTNTLDDYDRLIGDISSEAIKEFAERLKKEKYYSGNRMGYGTWVVEVESIDNLVKEMAGERE